MSFLKRPLWLILLFCLGCSAQSVAPDLNRRIERQVRAHFDLPRTVQITVGTPKPSEFSGYDTLPITFEAEGQKKTYEYLLSRDGKTLLRTSKIDISPEAYAKTLGKEVEVRKQQAELMKKIDVRGRPWRGAPDAKVSIVVYDDFQCPFCARMYRTLFDDLMKSHGDRVRVAFKDYPLFSIHPWARRAAIDANCLAELSNDAYWDFSDYVHLNQQQVSGDKRDLAAQAARLDALALDYGKKRKLDPTILQTCIKGQPDSVLNASVKEADSLGVTATPTLFINGEKVEGAVEGAELRRVLDGALRDAGQPLPAMAAETSKPADADKPAASTAAAPPVPKK